MSQTPVFTFHLAQTNLATTARALRKSPGPDEVAGLQHSECMTTMKLGGAVVSPSRLQLRHLAMFAAWDDEESLEHFLKNDSLGTSLADGWHVRMEFMRRWGSLAELGELPASVGEQDPDLPVVAVTIARLKHPQLLRFIKWGRPVERLVRDHPGNTLALAAMRPLRTVSTFSVWHSQREMTDMVHGHSDIPQPERHAVAMVERRRKDFHFEFTTLRFRATSEHGQWKGRTGIVPTAA